MILDKPAVSLANTSEFLKFIKHEHNGILYATIRIFDDIIALATITGRHYGEEFAALGFGFFALEQAYS